MKIKSLLKGKYFSILCAIIPLSIVGVNQITTFKQGTIVDQKRQLIRFQNATNLKVDQKTNFTEEKEKLKKSQTEINQELKQLIKEPVFDAIQKYGWILGINLDKKFEEAVNQTVSQTDFNSKTDEEKKKVLKTTYYQLLSKFVINTSAFKRLIKKHESLIKTTLESIKNDNNTDDNTKTKVEKILNKINQKEPFLSELLDNFNQQNNFTLLTKFKEKISDEQLNNFLTSFSYELVTNKIKQAGLGVSSLASLLFLILGIRKRRGLWLPIIGFGGAILSALAAGYLLFTLFIL